QISAANAAVAGRSFRRIAAPVALGGPARPARGLEREDRNLQMVKGALRRETGPAHPVERQGGVIVVEPLAAPVADQCRDILHHDEPPAVPERGADPVAGKPPLAAGGARRQLLRGGGCAGGRVSRPAHGPPRRYPRRSAAS